MNLDTAADLMAIEELLQPCGWSQLKTPIGWQWTSKCGNWRVSLSDEFSSNIGAVPTSTVRRCVKIVSVAYAQLMLRMYRDDSDMYRIVSALRSPNVGATGQLDFMLERELLILRAPMLPL